MIIYLNVPYTYRICWSGTKMNYYGVRYSKKCHPDDLFVSYFTSSKYVTDYIKENGPPDIIEIRKTFSGADRVTKAIEWEHRVLSKLDAVGRVDYLNRSNGKGIDPRISSAARKGMAPASKGKPMSEHTKNKMRKPKKIVTCPMCGQEGGISAMYRHHFDNCGKKMSSETTNKLASANTKKVERQTVKDIRKLIDQISRDDRTRLSVKLTNGWYQWTDERLHDILKILKVEIPYILVFPTPTKQRNETGVIKGIPDSTANRQPTIAQCPHCNKRGGASVMHRHHFKRCKMLIDSECPEYTFIQRTTGEIITTTIFKLSIKLNVKPSVIQRRIMKRRHALAGWKLFTPSDQ